MDWCCFFFSVCHSSILFWNVLSVVAHTICSTDGDTYIQHQLH